MRLVLLPGMHGTGNLFADFVKALPCIFVAETLSYPSDASLSSSELLKYLQSAIPASEPFVLIAESFSTPLAIQYAAGHPSRLKALILVAGFVTSPAHGWMRFLGSRLPSTLFGVPLPSFVAMRIVGPNAPPELISALRAAVSSVNPTVLSSRLRAVLACDARTELREVAVPILYIQAKQDCLVPASCLEEIRRIKPQTAVATIAGPHLILQREPQQSAAAVTEFIRQIEFAN
jgi:pimeloyl-[acyl-carrier protein] methyl ester esterase